MGFGVTEGAEGRLWEGQGQFLASSWAERIAPFTLAIAPLEGNSNSPLDLKTPSVHLPSSPQSPPDWVSLSSPGTGSVEQAGLELRHGHMPPCPFSVEQARGRVITKGKPIDNPLAYKSSETHSRGEVQIRWRPGQEFPQWLPILFPWVGEALLPFLFCCRLHSSSDQPV